MLETEILNYSHGNELQSICRQLLENLRAGLPYANTLQWLEDEKQYLLKNQTACWEPTVSALTYYKYLDRIGNMIHNHEDVVAFEALLQEICSKTRRKISALFLTQEPSCWPSLKSVYEAAQSSDDFITALVYTPFYHVNATDHTDYYEEYRSMGLPILRHGEYNLPLESPDIVFINKPYNTIPEPYQAKNLHCVVPRIIYIAYGLELTLDLIKFGFQYYAQYKAWRHCVYGDVVKEFGQRYGYRNGENIVVWGHPKADQYRDLAQKRESIPEEWKSFINGRKTILWTPHHLIDLESNGTGTWLIWGEKILSMAFAHPEIAFIIRPHPLMLGALINSGAMTERQVARMRERIDASSNIIWDESSSYLNAFYAADAIITDGTTFSFEFLYTQKPILLTPRNMKGFYLYQQMLDSYYIANTASDISNYIEMVGQGEDPLREKRLKFFRDTVFIPENCTVGENIMNHVKEDLTRECLNPAVTPELEAIVPKGSTGAGGEADAEYPLFSVLIVCYKNTQLLYGMLNTVFAQNYPRIQLIVSDDCSDDFDVDAVQAYIESNKRYNIESVIVRKNPRNMRTVRHIHDALELAEGEYVIFTAADDRFASNDAISCYAEAFLTKPEGQWIVGRCQFTSADYNTPLYTSPTSADESFFISGNSKLLYSRWSRRGMAIPCCMAFRRTAFDLVGGIDLDYQFMEDWPLVLKLLRQGYAPIYLDTVTAIHSTGGVTNSNTRYGKEIRKAFFDDKYLLFRKEVDPHLDLLTPEDRKCYRQYLREIMARHYFVNIDWPGTSVWQKLILLLKKPIAAWWMFELWYVNHVKHFERKKALVASQIVLLVSVLLLYFSASVPLQSLFRTIAYIDLALGLVLFILSIITFPLEKYFLYKAELRKNLVN